MPRLTALLAAHAVACATLIAPLRASAQLPDAAPPGYEEQCHPQTFHAEAHCHIVPRGSVPVWQPGQPPTIVAQIFAALGGTVILGGGAGFGTYVALGGRFNGDSCYECQVAAWIMALVGGLTGEAVGVWGAGELSGGDGSFVFTLLGTLVAGCIGAVGAYHMTADRVYDDELRSYEKMWGAPPPLDEGAHLRRRGAPTFTLVRFSF